MLSTKPTYYIIDFDSTFTQVEAMEELAEISLANDPEKDVLIEKIKQLTDLAMDGSMPFDKSLKARIALLSAKKYHIQMLVNRLRKRVSVSFARNKKFFKDCKGRVFIVSGGFKEFIVPVVKPYFIDADKVFANTFLFDKKNNIIGADEANILAQENGKVKLLKQLKLQGNVVVIGDGYTDYQIFEQGLAHKFFAYTENVVREKVLERAEFVAPSLDEILYTERLPMALSYPKTRLKALLWGEKTFLAEHKLREEGYKITKLELKASGKQLQEELQDAHLLLFEPEAKLGQLKKDAPKLLSAGVWGEMPDTGELGSYWAGKGIALFANQYAHTRSISEWVLSMMLQLNRLKQEELPGKKLGIIGYGNCGSLLSVMAANLGMEVYFYDTEDRLPLANSRRLKQLPELLKKCDIIVLTMGRRFGSGTLLGEREIKQLNKGAILINISRDESIDLAACKAALNSGKLSGFAIDRTRLKTAKDLEGMKQVLISNNQRLATKQTQSNISEIISEKLIEYVNTGSSKASLNFPNLNLPEQQNAHRFIHIHRNKPGILAQINNLLAQNKINIIGQYLKTNEQIGYVITDVGKDYQESLPEQLKAIPETIRFRVLY